MIFGYYENYIFNSNIKLLFFKFCFKLYNITLMLTNINIIYT